MKLAARTMVMALSAIAILIALSGAAAAKGPSHILDQSRLRPGSRVVCSRAVFRGSLTVSLYSLKGPHPSPSARRCARALAVVKAGKSDLSRRLRQSLGKRWKVDGAVYTLDGLRGRHGSGLTAAFVGAGTAVVAAFTAGI
jgi:hypothetical protein